MLMWTLFIGHGIGDWLLQNGKWAKEKTTNENYLVLHSLIYALCVILLLLTYKIISFHLLFAIFIILWISHIIIDSREPTIGWIKHIKLDKNPPVWLIFVIDQWFHIIILYIIARLI